MMYKARYKYIRRLLALLLALAVVMPAAPALAESYRAVVTGSAITVYAKSTLSGRSVRLPAYSVVKVTATQGNVAQLKNGGAVGYASLSNLTALGASSTAVATRATRVYQKPSLSGRSIAIPKGFRMTLLYSDKSVAIVQNKGIIAYAVPSHLSIESTGGSTNDSGVTVETYEATVIVNSLPVYAKASASAKKLGTLNAGVGVTVYAQNGTWAAIGKSGHYGFCALSGLERGAGQGSTGTLEGAIPVTVTASSMAVYAKASTSSKVLGKLPKGTQVNLIQTSGSWAYIELNGNYGYCAVSALTNQSSTGNNRGEVIDGHEPLGTATVILASAPVYVSMSTSSKYAVMRMGDTLSFYGYDSKWVLVGRDGVFGYMLRSTLNALNYAELKLESSGAGVVQLETALLNLGYLDAIPSSNYTAVTAAAVQGMQSAAGMTPTGSADLATLRVLYSGNAPASPILSASLSSGSKNSNVSRLQNRLLALGYLSRTSSVDGDYGSNTAGAVRLFQTAAGLSATGTADNRTIRALYSASAPRLASGQTPADQSGSGSGNSSPGNTTNVPNGLASTTSKYSAGMSNAQKLEYVIYVCQQQLGKRYVFGAAGTATFDCSGLMMYAFGKIGIRLQHSAKGEGYNDTWQKISSKASLKRGDMIFFNTVSDGDMCDHVGIVLGSNYFLHASSGAGKVTISSVASGYYSRVFSWGRRVLKT